MRPLQKLMGGLSGGFCEAVSWVFIPLRVLATILPNTFLPPVTKLTLVFWVGLEKSGHFGDISHSWGSWTVTHTLTFLCGRNHEPGKSLLALR